MFRKIALLLVIIFAAGCSQKGEVGVRNRTRGLVYLDIDGRGYELYPGDLIIREIEIGKQCVFGPDETRVLIAGEGDYLFYFSYMARVRDDETTIIPLYCDAAQLTVTNNTLYDLDLFIVDCSDPGWGSPCDYLPPGGQVVWKLDPGCWDVMVDGIEIAPASTRYGNMLACEDYRFTIYGSEYNCPESNEGAGGRFRDLTLSQNRGRDVKIGMKTVPAAAQQDKKREKMTAGDHLR